MPLTNIPAENALPPLVVDTADAAPWDEAADFVVVGFGGAGVAAALEAAELGVSVIAVDRFSGGGATRYSGGVIYAADTKHQRQAGIQDNTDEMFKYLKAEGTPLSDLGLKRFCDESAANMDWVEKHGVPYGGSPYPGKTSFPPDGYWIYYSGNEKTPEFESRAKAAPRGHRVVTPGFGGHIHFGKLRDAALALGVKVIPHAPVTRLITDRTGSVVGVEINALPESAWAEHDALDRIVDPWKPLNGPRAERGIVKAREMEKQLGKAKRIRARAGVVLSTGGYTYNLGMLARYRPEVAPSYEGLLRLGSMGCDGSGIQLGETVGGATRHMERMFLGSPLSPPVSYTYGAIVNANGERYINEDAYHSKVGNLMSKQPGMGKSWLILDWPTFRKAMRQSLFPGKGMFMMWGAPVLFNVIFGGTRWNGTLEGLARSTGIDPAGLRRTVEEINATAHEHRPDRLGKGKDKIHPIEHGPFFAVNISIANKFCPTMMFTLGGLMVDEETGAVLDAQSHPIPGLYAAGRTAVSVCTYEYMSGMSIADTVFSGRRAARHAASLVQKHPLQAAGGSA